MSKRYLTSALAVLLIITIVAPAAFFIAPPRANASAISCIGGLIGIGSAIASVPAALLSVPVNSVTGNLINGSTAGSTGASCINDMILIPLARAAIRAILQQMTASVINWITGKSGNGQPSFVTNLSVHLQAVGDAAALSFIARTATAFNSPFGSAISASLQRTYNQQTSLAGFFAANQSTLAQATPNVNSFLAGNNWTPGAWFALTAPGPDNPYILYQAALGQVGSNVNQAVTNRRQDLIQSQGFLSFCGGDTTAASSGSGGVKPQAPCTNPDGTPANAQTPGSVIHDYAAKALGSGWDQLVAANDIDSALGTIMNVLINQVLGSATGLLGASAPSTSRPAITSQLQNYSASNTAAAAAATTLTQTTLAQLAAYTSAWDTIAAAANTASTSVKALISYCNAQATNPNASPSVITAQVNAAQTALTTEIAPVLAQAQAAFSSAATTKTLALKVQAEATAVTSPTSGTNGSAGALSADTQALAAAPPSVSDIAFAQQNASTGSGATANPVGSLAVSGGTLVDQMNLIGTNATTLQSVCNPVANTSFNASPAG